MQPPIQHRQDMAMAKDRQRAMPSDPRIHVSLEQLLLLRAQASGFSFLPKQPVHSLLTGKHGSHLRGRGLNFEEIRSYQPGDDIRTIDWKVTARTRHPHIRVYSEERDRSVLLVVDQRNHMFFGSQDRMKSVTAAEAGALGAWRVLEMGDRVGSILFGDESIQSIKPQRSENTVMQMLNELVSLNQSLSAEAPKKNSAQLNRALERALQVCTHDYLVVIISDFEGADAETLRLTTRLAEHNDILGLYVYDPLRSDPREAGRVTLTDGTEQMEIDLDSASLRKKIADDYQHEMDDLTHTLQKLSAPLLPISTVGDVAVQIRALLGFVPGGAR